MLALGRWLYRWRELLGVLGYLAVLALSECSRTSLLLGLPAVLLGLGLRCWAAGFIGPHGRGREILIVEPVQSGPYRLTAHPLYLGNGLLVAGVLVSLAPPWWLRVVIATLFIIEYWLIARTETKELQATGTKPQTVRAAWRMRWALGEWRTVVTVGAALALGALKGT